MAPEIPTQPREVVSNEILLERITNLSADVCDIRALLEKYIERERQWEKDSAEVHTKLQMTVEAAHRRLDVHDQGLEKLEAKNEALKVVLEPLKSTNRVLLFIGGILGSSIIVLIWMVITHLVTIVYP